MFARAAATEMLHRLPGSRRGFIKTTAGLLGSSALAGFAASCDDDGVVVLANHTQTHMQQFGNDLLCMIPAGCEAE